MKSAATSSANSPSAAAVSGVATPDHGIVWPGPRAFGIAVVIAVLGGCTQYRPYIPDSEGHIEGRKVDAQSAKAIPPPARVSTFVPAPKPAPKPQTYTVVVNEVPVKDLLLALARDTKQNIDIHSGLTGLVSLNAINETLPAILERVSKQVNMRYRTEGNTIIVSPDASYVKTYRIGYVNMVRDTTSTIGVNGEIVASGAGAGGGASSSGGSGGSSTVVRTTDRKSTRLNSSHMSESRMPSSA